MHNFNSDIVYLLVRKTILYVTDDFDTVASGLSRYVQGTKYKEKRKK